MSVVQVGDLTNVAVPSAEPTVSTILEDDVSERRYGFVDESGSLRSVRIKAPETPGQPYLWGVDYSATVDHVSGEACVAFHTAGPYIVEVRREVAGSISMRYECVFFRSHLGQVIDDERLDPTLKITGWKAQPSPPPPSDVNAISTAKSAAGGFRGLDGFLGAARIVYVNNHHKLQGIDMLRGRVGKGFSIRGILEAHSEANGGSPMTVMTVDHGATAMVGLGAGVNLGKRNAQGRWYYLGQWLSNAEDDDMKAWFTKFISICKANKVSRFQFFSCAVAHDQDRGGAFLQKMANDADMTVVGATSYVALVRAPGQPPYRFFMEKSGEWLEFSDKENE